MKEFREVAPHAQVVLDADDVFFQTRLGPAVPETYRRLADLAPQRLAIMHGSSYDGDCVELLRAMAVASEHRYGCNSRATAQSLPGHDRPVGAV